MTHEDDSFLSELAEFGYRRVASSAVTPLALPADAQAEAVPLQLAAQQLVYESDD